MLVDTNVLIRTLQPHHPLFVPAERAIQRLLQLGRALHILPQNLIELWAVITRPLAQNGLGMSTAAASMELLRIKSIFELLPEISAIYPIWEDLVVRYRVSGKPTHDARLVAGMHVHGLEAILTFDKSGFSRYQGIEVLDPMAFVQSQ